ncbi:ASCH/PUA domain-containing protein [Aeromonas salmonicida]|uniref:ASCH/PUA domain-containing protein n=1 Tax=Aeromonas salmonicida TaxID=645 RepID=UPI0038BDA641
MKHELKIKPEYFAAIYFGEKTFEIRNNADRNFQVGDTLLLKAWDGEFTGDFVEKVVSYITDFEQKPGYVVLGLVNHREHELLEKFHRTGVAIERAISTGSVLADHPLKSRLDLLANHHEREMELAAQLSDATRQCGVMAGLLREARNNVDQVRRWGRFDHDEGCGAEAALLLERIDAALAGKLPDQPLDMVSLSDIASLQRYTIATIGVVDGKDHGAEMEEDDEGEYVLLADALMLSSATKPEPTKDRTITEGQEFELATVLQAIANGFSDDPAHDAAALLKRITGEVPWTGDSFQIPPRQGGEPCVSASPSSSPD